MIKIAINGFGRIGRNTLRNILSRNLDFEIVAINDLADSKTLAHLFKYDSVHGLFQGKVKFENDFLIIDHRRIKVLCEKDPEKLPWTAMDIDVVVESTGS